MKKPEKTLVLLPEKCPRNHSCSAVKACPAGALTQIEHLPPVVDVSKCTKCGKCTRRCPKGVFVIK
ncbi:MAG: 4Fe-4S binding protein [Eubacteriales bacterium]|nr:4Fe-4S binding protein [Eubacteriales bacterium]MDD4422155.1 4Fe-4S binding protein [Eubacteriales bacterium]HBR31266.1 4Fe-4S ferredoxin [Clostridiales bacterium]